MSQAAELNRRFAIADILAFEQSPDGFVVAQVTTRHASARIALQGAHVMSYQPAGQPPLIWLSKLAKLAPGKSIRGGVPVCWPWFGAHPSNAQFPGHGFARTVPWQLIEATLLPDHRLHLEFELVQSDATRARWPQPSTLRNSVTVGPELEVELATTNTGSVPFELGQALHTYFEIGDIRQTTITGLDACDYLDKVDGGTRKTQHGAVDFSGETDRIYLATHGHCEIHDPLLKRRILVTSTGSHSTVVWSPWTEKADKMGDFCPEGWTSMVCVETANAAEDVIQLAPGATHRMTAQYRSIGL
ncbi:MAG: D-hexose-6-phosphate mutarotase [Rhodocyclales bacterium RIFCSPLOWO2_02_FULL_63_24]|nr:MAG: D-hexose-6-phosphate mutarotase [Rhodocyclales bacterium RIFCSPLOWO2_02_FULL_63_24]